MKLIEHLETVIGLVDNKAPYLEIKRALLGMYQEVEAYDHREAQSAAEAGRIKKEYAALTAKHEALVAKNATPEQPPVKLRIEHGLKLPPQRR